MDEVKDEATWCDVVADDLLNMGTENFAPSHADGQAPLEVIGAWWRIKSNQHMAPISASGAIDRKC